MLLKAFQIRNYKSFLDSGRCSVNNGVTILAGQNESGKTNILTALEKINDPSPTFSEIEFSFDNADTSPEIVYWFDLTVAELSALSASFPDIQIEPSIEVVIHNKTREIHYVSNPTSDGNDDADDGDSPAEETLNPQVVIELEKLLPKIIFYKTLVDDIPDSFTSKDLTTTAVKRLSAYLDYDFKKIFDTTNQQKQRSLTHGLSRSISDDFSAKYRQKDVELEFDINSSTISIYVYDKQSKTSEKGYPFHLSQRSMGLRWYLNFYIALKGEDLKPGDIILVDEPGMYLHPKAQQEMRDILNEESKSNQIIYTTHSPYLIDADNISQIRLVEKRGVDLEDGYNEISEIKEKIHHGGIDTLKPITDAIGYSLSSELNLQHKKILICEGVSDYYYVKALSQLCDDPLSCGITHANGCANIWRVASLFLGLGIPDIYVLVDSDKAGIRERTKLLEANCFDEAHFLTTDEPTNLEKTIEDIFNRDAFLCCFLGYTAEEIAKVNVPLSKIIGDKPNGTKYATAKQFYEKAINLEINIEEFLSDSGKKLLEKIKPLFKLSDSDGTVQ